jgi:hypothetical protein
MNKRFSPAGLFLLTAWLALLVLVMVRTTLALPYISDDFEHVQLIAQIRAGLAPGHDLLTLPFHGQTVVLVRLLFWFGTLAGGMNLTWVRLGVCAAHVAGAVGCAVLCTRWTGSRLAGWLAGTLYAGALGFIGEQIWWPSSAIFCLGVTFLIFAMVAMNPDAKHPKVALALSVLMLALAALGLNGILVAAIGVPIFWRRRAAVVFLAAIALLLVLTLLQHDQEHLTLSERGLGLGAWLVFTAPLRFFSGFTTFALPGFRTIWKLAPLAWLPLLASAWFMNARYRRVLLTLWTPAILLALLVGMARADYPFRFGPGSLYTADRYYYVFLLPLVTQCVLSASVFKMRRVAVALLAILAGAALIASDRRYLANVPRANFEITGHALQQGRVLVEKIRSYPGRPLLLADAAIPMDGARNNSLTLAFLIYAEYPHGIAGVRLVQHSLKAGVENGLFVPVRASSYIDFGNASYEENLVSGFSWWEAPFRWMGARGSLHLIAAPGDLVISAYAPVDQLHRTIHVSVTVNDHPAGGFAITTPGLREYHLQPPALAPGAVANITLTSDVVWHARDIFPQSLDDRDLSIALSAIGFAVRP